jgi:hypothetical protein
MQDRHRETHQASGASGPGDSEDNSSRNADIRVPILRLAVKYSTVRCSMFNFLPDTELSDNRPASLPRKFRESNPVPKEPPVLISFAETNDLSCRHIFDTHIVQFAHVLGSDAVVAELRDV